MPALGFDDQFFVDRKKSQSNIETQSEKKKIGGALAVDDPPMATETNKLSVPTLVKQLSKSVNEKGGKSIPNEFGISIAEKFQIMKEHKLIMAAESDTQDVLEDEFDSEFENRETVVRGNASIKKRQRKSSSMDKESYERPFLNGESNPLMRKTSNRLRDNQHSLDDYNQIYSKFANQANPELDLAIQKSAVKSYSQMILGNNEKLDLDKSNPRVNISFGPEDQISGIDDRKNYVKALKKLEADLKELTTAKKPKSKTRKTPPRQKPKTKNLRAEEFVRLTKTNLRKFFDEDFMNLNPNSERKILVLIQTRKRASPIFRLPSPHHRPPKLSHQGTQQRLLKIHDQHRAPPAPINANPHGIPPKFIYALDQRLHANLRKTLPDPQNPQKPIFGRLQFNPNPFPPIRLEIQHNLPRLLPIQTPPRLRHRIQNHHQPQRPIQKLELNQNQKFPVLQRPMARGPKARPWQILPFRLQNWNLKKDSRRAFLPWGLSVWALQDLYG